MGADAVLVVTPAYVKPSQKGLVKFYQTVADKGDLPVILYNVREEGKILFFPKHKSRCSAKTLPGFFLFFGGDLAVHVRRRRV